MSTCGYVCPKCEGKGFLEDGNVCDWCGVEVDLPVEAFLVNETLVQLIAKTEAGLPLDAFLVNETLVQLIAKRGSESNKSGKEEDEVKPDIEK